MGGTWNRLDKVVLGSAGTTLECSGFTPKTFLRFEAYIKGDGSNAPNGRLKTGGLADGFEDHDHWNCIQGSNTSSGSWSNEVDDHVPTFSGSKYDNFVSGYITNIDGLEKLIIITSVDNVNVEGTATVPTRRRVFGKWIKTSGQCDRIKIYKTAGGNYQADSWLTVWGSDDADSVAFGNLETGTRLEATNQRKEYYGDGSGNFFVRGTNPSTVSNVAYPAFDSVYESLNPLTTVAKKRFVDFFGGQDLTSSVWYETNVTGSGTFAMVDAVDGGFGITSGSGANRESNISFGWSSSGSRPFSATGSVAIWVGKVSATSGMDTNWGLSNDAGAAHGVTSDHQATWQTYDNDQYLFTTGGSGYTRTAVSPATDMGTDWRVGKIECKSSTVDLTVDGTITATNSTNTPTASLQPKMSVYGNGKTGYVRYCEVYNT